MKRVISSKYKGVLYDTETIQSLVPSRKLSKRRDYLGSYWKADHIKDGEEGTAEVVSHPLPNMDVLFSELRSYKGTVCERFAISLIRDLRGVARQFKLSDGVDAYEKTIEVAENLEILETALMMFEEQTGVTPSVSALGDVFIFSENGAWESFSEDQYDEKYDSSKLNLLESSARSGYGIPEGSIPLMRRGQIFDLLDGQHSPEFILRNVLLPGYKKNKPLKDNYMSL